MPASTSDEERREEERRQARKKEGRRISIALYISAAFVLTAATTVLITASAIVVVYNFGGSHMRDTDQLYATLLVAGIAALILSVGFGLMIASSIGTPIHKITKAAKAIRDGDLSARVHPRGDDELAQLGAVFDEMADAIERDRDLEQQLIGDVAHELRTPLMAIQATAEAIQDGVFPADEEHIGTISSETQRLGRLVEALLHLNRLENGATEVKRDPIDITSLIDEIIVSNEAFVESSGIKLVAEVESGVRIIGDRDLMLQAITNLLSNAVRYTPENGTVTVRVERHDGNACISVVDTGIGLDEEDLNKVFSRFWRADSARASITGGLGIGLALVKEVADQHRGNVTVESRLGEGSTFTINVPLAPDDASVTGSFKVRGARRFARDQKREQDKLRKIQERQEKASQRESRTLNVSQQLALFGRRVSRFSKKDDDGRIE